MPIQITELVAKKTDTIAGYPGGVFVDVMIKNTGFLTPYKLTIAYLDPEGGLLYTDSERGILRRGEEKGVHSESSWSADMVKATVSPFGLGLFADSEEVEPE